MKPSEVKSILIIFFLIANLFSGVVFSQEYVPGETYYDSTGYVEYRAGNLPIVFSAPHGGDIEPLNIPDRDCTGCVYVKDSWTKPITEGIYAQFFEETGCYPHVIINLLHRKKFDANRDIDDAADGNPIVESAWSAYHDFIDSAKAQIVSDYEKGIFLDIHGHAHDIERIELGYLLNGSELRMPDTELNTTEFIEESSIKHLVRNNIQEFTHSNLLRGELSLGSILDGKGFPSVPSVNDPFPDIGESYFSGGYNTQRHGSRDNEESIDGIQIELNSDVRFDATQRELLIEMLTVSANEYINHHYNSEYTSNFCSLLLNVPEYEEQKHNIKIFPNPAKKLFNIESDIKDLEILIYDALGRIVYSKSWIGNQINIEFLPNGYYFIKLKKEEEILSILKLVKY